jgi:predicted acyltransferase
MTQRATSLDALRGFAILTMVLSGVIPYRVLPAWMYHAQLPPPGHQLNAGLPGLTWVDLVFPLFLFALGAAVPLALGRRIEKGNSEFSLLKYIIERTFLLTFFAVFLHHIRPHQIQSEPDTITWLLALCGFIVLSGIFTGLPQNWNKKIRYTIKISAWLIAIVMMALITYKDNTGFSLHRSDIIIIVLANSYFFVSLIWLITRNNLLIRIAILFILIALRLSHSEIGWVHWLWEFSPIPWFYKLYYLQYLFIVIPGSIVGDMIVDWIKKHGDNPCSNSWAPSRFILITVVAILLVLVHLIGLQSRWLWQTWIVALVLSAGMNFLVINPVSETEKLLKKLVAWSTAILIIGHCLEPFEGGIKKDPSTLSYYFITTALSVHILMIMFNLIEVFKQNRYLRVLVENGQNPMMAYVGFANFIWPILALTGLEQIFIMLTPTPWLGFLRGVFYTFLIAFAVSFCTRKRIFWRT